MKTNFLIVAFLLGASFSQFANAQNTNIMVDPATGKQTDVAATQKSAATVISADKTFFTSMQNMTPVMKGERLSSSAQLVSFKVTIISKGAATRELECKGSILSPEIKKEFLTLKSGDTVNFENILVSEGVEMKKFSPKNYLVQ